MSCICAASNFLFYGSPLVIRSTTCNKWCDLSEPLTFKLFWHLEMFYLKKAYCRICHWICFHYLPESTYLDYSAPFVTTGWWASAAQKHPSKYHLSPKMLPKRMRGEKPSSNTLTLTPNNKEIRSGRSPGVRLGQIEDQMSISPVELCKHHISTTFHHQLIHLMDPTI